MIRARDEFLRFEIVRQGYNDQTKWGYVHCMSIVAVSPSFIRGGSGLVLANGGTIFVEESPDDVMKMLQEDEGA